MRKLTYLLLVTLLLLGCGGSGNNSVTIPVPVVVPPAPVETYDQFLKRTEGVTCAVITAHDMNAPIPDCHKIVDAINRGRVLATQKFGTAAVAAVKLSSISFWQTQLVWNANEGFPRIKDIGSMAETLVVGNSIMYAFEETIEHEWVHWVYFVLEGNVPRTQSAIDAQQDADQKANGYIYEKDITCHKTTDDPIVDARVSLSVSGRAGCINPYSGPSNPAA